VNTFIPRSQRWTNQEREQKKLDSQNRRTFAKMVWAESESFRQQIENEISAKKLARIAALE
jgi:hypothetical protein